MKKPLSQEKGRYHHTKMSKTEISVRQRIGKEQIGNSKAGGKRKIKYAFSNVPFSLPSLFFFYFTVIIQGRIDFNSNILNGTPNECMSLHQEIIHYREKKTKEEKRQQICSFTKTWRDHHLNIRPKRPTRSASETI